MCVSGDFWFCFYLFFEDEGPGRMVSVLSASREKRACESMSCLMSPKKYLRLKASSVPSLLSLYVMVPPTLCYLVFHCEFLPFLKQFSQYVTGSLISSITL